MAKECSNSTSKCFTRILDGNTIRGCASDLDNKTASRCNNEMECLICSFMEGCNRNVFPTHRLTCLQCEGTNNGTCANEVYAKSTVCPIYKLGDKCFIRNTGLNATTSFQRGCLTSAQSKKLCVDERNCYTCEGSSCNHLAYGSELIPIARDSAGLFGYSLLLVVAGILTTRYF
ncbi:uncharacterized protein LOC119671284 [Teleopsis dalmanni]|uniref:uncharacterized protein LOC119671284 n=1 Tax=Teleopsis dalmanni TaxID=139649 RepID=UPI0018CC9708|nr:uncharacterized protein LOC119671284 [Teleopsis dalmanni]